MFKCFNVEKTHFFSPKKPRLLRLVSSHRPEQAPPTAQGLPFLKAHFLNMGRVHFSMYWAFWYLDLLFNPKTHRNKPLTLKSLDELFMWDTWQQCSTSVTHLRDISLPNIVSSFRKSWTSTVGSWWRPCRCLPTRSRTLWRPCWPSCALRCSSHTITS